MGYQRKYSNFAELIDLGAFPIGEKRTNDKLFMIAMRQLPVPETATEAKVKSEVLKSEITDMHIQSNKAFDRLECDFNGDEYEWGQWHISLKKALRIKQSQLFALKMWLKNKQGDFDPVATLKQEFYEYRTRSERRISRLSATIEQMAETFTQVMIDSPYASKSIDNLISMLEQIRADRGKEIGKAFLRDAEIMRSQVTQNKETA